MWVKVQEDHSSRWGGVKLVSHQTVRHQHWSLVVICSWKMLMNKLCNFLKLIHKHLIIREEMTTKKTRNLSWARRIIVGKEKCMCLTFITKMW